MRISVEKAATRLDELVARAERGEDVLITRDDMSVVILQPFRNEAKTSAHRATQAEKRMIMDEIRQKAVRFEDDGVSAARSQDFLYGEDGLPG